MPQPATRVAAYMASGTYRALADSDSPAGLLARLVVDAHLLGVELLVRRTVTDAHAYRPGSWSRQPKESERPCAPPGMTSRDRPTAC